MSDGMLIGGLITFYKEWLNDWQNDMEKYYSDKRRVRTFCCKKCEKGGRD